MFAHAKVQVASSVIRCIEIALSFENGFGGGSEMKPCPFCGSTRIEKRRSGVGWYIVCDDCGMGFSSVVDPEENWNTRPVEDDLLEACEAALEREQGLPWEHQSPIGLEQLRAAIEKAKGLVAHESAGSGNNV